MVVKGLDWSFARPPIVEMPKWGYTYAFRYLCYRTTNTIGKILTPAELKTILAVMDVWANWEWYSSRAKEGRVAGLLDGHEAHGQLVALGWPVGAYIIVSDDSGTTGPNNIAAVLAYLDGFQQNCPDYEVVAYGNDYLVNAWFAHRARKSWQTLAWSGGRRSLHAFAYQNGNQAFNGGADENLIYDATGSYKSAHAALVDSSHGQHPVPDPRPPLPIHDEGEDMYGYLHAFGNQTAKGWPGVYVVSLDLSSRTHVNDVHSLAFLQGTKKYPTSGLSDAQVSAIPISK